MRLLELLDLTDDFDYSMVADVKEMHPKPQVEQQKVTNMSNNNVFLELCRTSRATIPSKLTSE